MTAPKTTARRNLVQSAKTVTLLATDGGANDGQGVELTGTSDGAAHVFIVGSDTMRSIPFDLDYTDLTGLGAGVKSATFIIKAAATLPAGQIIKVFSESASSPDTTWAAFDDGAGALYAINAGNVSLSNGLLASMDVSNGTGATGIVSPFLGDYALGNAIMPTPAENLTLTISSNVDLNTTTAGHLSLLVYIGNALPA